MALIKLEAQQIRTKVNFDGSRVDRQLGERDEMQSWFFEKTNKG